MANSDDEAKFLSEKLRMSADTLRSLPRGADGTGVSPDPTVPEKTLRVLTLYTIDDMLAHAS